MSSILAATFSLESVEQAPKDCSNLGSSRELACEWALINQNIADSKALEHNLAALQDVGFPLLMF